MEARMNMGKTIKAKLFTEDEVIDLLTDAEAQMVKEIADNEGTTDKVGIISVLMMRLNTILQENIDKLYK